MSMIDRQRGDTIIEVILAFTIFALIAVSTTYLMNRSMAIGQQSLEVTLVRQQVDSQAELLRYARDNELAAWDAIRNAPAASVDSEVSFETCPARVGDLPAQSFVMNLSPSDVERIALNGSNFAPARYISEVEFGSGATPTRSYGLWITPVQVEGGGSYDMYIRACWDTAGSDVPRTISTIVRLYET